jgi:hypothetical protein
VFPFGVALVKSYFAKTTLGMWNLSEWVQIPPSLFEWRRREILRNETTTALRGSFSLRLFPHIIVLYGLRWRRGEILRQTTKFVCLRAVSLLACAPNIIVLMDLVALARDTSTRNRKHSCRLFPHLKPTR